MNQIASTIPAWCAAVLLLSCLLVCPAGATGAEAGGPEIVSRAARVTHDQPMPWNRLGLAEVLRTRDETAEAVADSVDGSAAVIDPKSPHAAAYHRLLCWRMLPPAEASLDAFAAEADRLRGCDPKDPWAAVYSLYTAHRRQDRAALVSAATAAGAAALPAAFPTVAAEGAHLDLLARCGVGRAEAGLHVIAHRAYAPLHALLDLDRGLSREAEFLRSSGRADDAGRLESCRDRLRAAYLASSRHVIERLFALNLLGRQKEADDLLAAARGLPHLTDPRKLADVLQRTDPSRAWETLIRPLLDGEVAALHSPTRLGAAAAAGAAKAELTVEARKKSVGAGVATYEGAVSVTFAEVTLRADRLAVVVGEGDGEGKAGGDSGTGSGTSLLTGSGNVRVGGIPGLREVTADHLSFDTETGEITLGGDVRLVRWDRPQKLCRCTLTLAGDVRNDQGFLTDFARAATVQDKLDLLGKVPPAFTDDELPDEAKYLLALRLLQPHLSWHPPYPPAETDAKQAERLEPREVVDRFEVAMGEAHQWRWSPAHAGEAFMEQAALREAEGRRLRDLRPADADDKQQQAQQPRPPAKLTAREAFWRLKDPGPGHADVARALALLDAVKARELAPRARRWAADVRRNNTVLTFDVPGGFAKGGKPAVVIDARAADDVTLKLYRVRKPEDLLAVAQRVGEDFLYRDHGLQFGQALQAAQSAKRLRAALDASRARRKLPPLPEWDEADLVRRWEVRVSELPSLPPQPLGGLWAFDDWIAPSSSDGDAWYFDDACSAYRPRIEKDYREGRGDPRAPGAWQCDRIVRIPDGTLTEAGAYVLVGEANGQTAVAPIVVDPVSLTLRRARDGVFAMVSDADGRRPVDGARVLGPEMIGDAVTDAHGAAFAKLWAGGDRPIVAAAPDGRFAVGGFGRVFEGVYRSVREFDAMPMRQRSQRMMKDGPQRAASAQAFADRYVLAAYTDRPTYRPGQEVNFKLIVRRLKPEADGGGRKGFRAEDFELSDQLEIPENAGPLEYAVLNPKGRAVAGGRLTLNDFGTAVGKLALSSEEMTGPYTLRVNVGGAPRLLPETFAVRYYRRPNFELTVTGAPDGKVTGPASLKAMKLSLAGRYYFGKPVAGGTVDVRLVAADAWKPLAETRATLDADGGGAVTLACPSPLPAGEYLVIAALTDDSGRTVSRSLPFEVEWPAPPGGAAAAGGIAKLPRFVPAGTRLEIKTAAEDVTAEQTAGRQTTRVRAAASGGVAQVTLASPGWYMISDGRAAAEIFAYGGDAHPLDSTLAERAKRQQVRNQQLQQQPNPDERPQWLNEWVDLTAYPSEDDGSAAGSEPGGDVWNPDEHHLLALFDRRHAAVGEKLRVLLYTPNKDARAVLTVEGATVVDYVVPPLRPDAHYHLVELPISRRHLPNFYLQGYVISQGQPGLAPPLRQLQQQAAEQAKQQEDQAGEDPRWCRVDVHDPAAAVAGGERLSVKIDVDGGRDTFGPGDEVGVTVTATDRAGRPREAEVSLAAVDESVFSFGEDRLGQLATAFADPHPTRRYFQKSWRSSLGNRWSQNGRRAQAVQQAARAQQQAQQMQQLKDVAQKVSEKLEGGVSPLRPAPSPVPAAVPPAHLDGQLPVAGLPLLAPRTDFRETATWQPQLRTGPDGKVKTSFKLPDSLTAFRLSAAGLTKQTEIGTARASLRVTRPLSVQVFLPRFSVQSDRLLAVALVHNNGDAARTCEAAWEVEGVEAGAAEGGAGDWETKSAAGRTTVKGRVTVGPRQSARVGLWLNASAIATAKVAFAAADGQDADSERRELPVHPLGREREVALNGEFDSGRASVRLPAGFVARELHVSMSRQDIPGALDGLEYLVEYPYGCVEQTMSRFLPAVMVAQAAKSALVGLPPEVAARLPDVLNKGLARLYNFQHADGGWGWYEKDATNDGMSIYVVDGLARCRNAGVAVDAEVLRRGCDFVKSRLADGDLPADLQARAWLALATAGAADRQKLEAAADTAPADPPRTPEARATLALACDAAGLAEPAGRLWATLGDWEPQTASDLALKLVGQTEFGAPLAECRRTADRLVALRQGYRWDNTVSTARAIQALAGMLRYVPAQEPARKVGVAVGGQQRLDVAPADLGRLVHGLSLSGDQLPAAADGAEIELTYDCDDLVRYAVTAVGTQQLDRFEATGTDVKLTRRYLTLDGRPLEGAVTVGDVIAVELQLDLSAQRNYLLIEDFRPAGFEFADERTTHAGRVEPADVAFRDDRVGLSFTSLPAGRHRLTYYLRAEAAGTSHVLPGRAYPMYEEKLRGETASATLEVRPGAE